MKLILNDYAECFNQCINFDKSFVFFSSNIPEDQCLLGSRMLAVRYSNKPEHYLALPNLVGRCKKLAFQGLKDVKQKVNGWNSRFLSQGGREVFIKAVLQTVPSYSMTYFLLSKSFCTKLKGIISKFWWQKAHNKRYIHWCEWSRLCDLKGECVLEVSQNSI